MAVGYALGPVFQRERRARLQWLLALGAAVTLGFIVIRATNLYGDPTPWAVQDGALATVLSFINCEKYPLSLLYLMLTLGRALFLLAAFEGARGRVADFITTYGRVPFFYYVAHIYLIHAFAVVGALLASGDAAWLLGALPHQKPPGYGLSLAGIYTIWLVVIVTLYPFCAWFAALKQRRRAWWLSYL
jgi:uncharacterized membrane protein